MTRHPIVLIILDGFGIGERDQSNPMNVAKMPTFEQLAASYPSCSLQASGISVGLPWNEEGNSEVGHLTIGAGRIIYQHYPKITLAIRSGDFFKNPAIINAFEHAKKFKSNIHLIGLLSKANVHSSYEHLLSILKIARDYFAQNPNPSKVYFHLFSDGRDSPPYDGLKLAQEFKETLKEAGVGEIATLTGRHWAMNRNREWEKTEFTYNILTGAPQDKGLELEEVYKKYYERKISDEFIEPTVIKGENRSEGMPFIKDNDAIFFFDFREDSARQLFQSFADPNFNNFLTKKFNNLYIASMTHYLKKIKTPVAFPSDEIKNTLAEVLSNNNLNQIHIAETEKYAHITFFFNAYREAPFPGETRILIPSIHPSSLVLERPEMRAPEITDRIILALQDKAYDFIVANYANADVLGHTANWDACIKTLEILDSSIKKVVEEGLKFKADIIITSDHGNIERIMNPRTGEPETQHDASFVPFYLISEKFKRKKFVYHPGYIEKRAEGILSDIAPTILELLEIPKPSEMTGESLLKKIIVN